MGSEPTNVTVVVSSYNQPNTLRLALEGLFRQEREDFEVIVADDGSEEDTHELVSKSAERAPFSLRLVTQKDRGFRKAKALNNGIRCGKGKFFLFLDGDCIARSDWITRHVDSLNS